VMGTAKATINAIHFMEARVVGHRRRRRPPSQLDWFIYGHDRAAKLIICLRLEKLRRRYEHGDPEALLEALDICCRGYWCPPPWVMSGYVNSYEAWRSYKMPTLDAAFGVVRHYDSKQLKSLREQEEARVFIVAQTERLRRRGESVSKDLFRQVGEKIGRGATFVSDVLYAPASAVLRKLFEKIPMS